jgi:magnesium-transporting ATPase (P-type)
VAYKRLDPRQSIESLRRDEAESSVDFLGLLVFQNQLRHDTGAVLSTLADGDIRSVIITGDNGYTTTAVSRGCRLIPSTRRVLMADLVNGCLQWIDIDSGQITPLPDIEFLRRNTSDSSKGSSDMKVPLLDDIVVDTELPEIIPELAITGIFVSFSFSFFFL